MSAKKPETSARWGRPLDPALERALIQYITSVAFSVTMGTLVTGQFLTGYALLVGAGDFEIGLLAAVATWAGLGSILAPAIIERWRSNKLPALWFLGISRSSWLLVLVPAVFGHAKEPWTLWLLLVASGVFTLAGSIVYPAWLSWVRSLVPADIRGRYFGLQSVTSNLTTMAALQLGGQFLDLWGGWFGKGNPHGFIICYGFGLVMASVGLSIRRKVPEPPFARERARPSLRRLMLLPLADPAFRKFILFQSWWYFSAMIVSPFAMVYMLKHLKIPYSTIALLSNMSTIAILISARVWGRLIDKFTAKPVLLICCPVMCVILPLWLFSTPQNYVILYFLNFFSGFFASAINLSMVNMILRIAPREHGSAYYAAENAIVSLAGAVGPLLGGWVAQRAEGVEVRLGGLRIYHLHFVFLAAAAVRLGGLLLLRRIHEPREKGVLFMLRVIRRVPGLSPIAATWGAAHSLARVVMRLLRRGRLRLPRLRSRPPR